MEDRELREILSESLDRIHLSDAIKRKIKDENQSRNKVRRRIYKIPAVVAASFLIFTTTAFAGYYIYNKISVNNEVLPELDSMEVCQVPSIIGEEDEDGCIKKEYPSYQELNKDLGDILLESKFVSENQKYEKTTVDTDNENYMFIHVDNYIVGDVKKMEKLEDIDKYSFEPGEIYGSPIFLNAELILSDDQLESGIDFDFLGYYTFQEQYTSKQGYKVNIVSSNVSEGKVPSEKNAIFVAEGIRYRVQGCVSTETLKKIVDSME